MEEKRTLPNEEAAEHRANIAGWVCKTCRRFFGDDEGAERTARFCCEKDHACDTEGCQNRTERAWIYCERCRERKDAERWVALSEVDWDGDTPLVLDRDDTYLYSEDDLVCYLEENDLKVEDIRLIICVEDDPPHFEMSEFLCDYLPEGDVSLGSEEIDAEVNKWIKESVPTMWVPGKTRPSLKSLKLYQREPQS